MFCFFVVAQQIFGSKRFEIRGMGGSKVDGLGLSAQKWKQRMKLLISRAHDEKCSQHFEARSVGFLVSCRF